MLPPYGRTVHPQATSQVYIFAGWHHQVQPYLGYHAHNTIGLFLFDDPYSYTWPVADRDCLVFCWFKPDDVYMERLAYCLFQHGAARVAVSRINADNIFTTIIYTRN